MDQARLRPAQVGASTAAAVGGAFLASRLGVYGTIIGVGVITLMSTVGSEMLLRSLERTKQAARTATPRLRMADQVVWTAAIPTSAPDEETTISQPVTTASVPPAATTEHTRVDEAEVTTTEQPVTASLPATTAAPGDDQPAKARRWPIIAGGFLASFGLALAVVAGIEAFTGQSLDGEGRPTVINVIRGDEQRTDDAPSVPATPTDEATRPQEDDPASPGDPEDGTAPRTEPTSPVESPSPGETATAPPDDDGTPPPDDDAETPPAEDETTPPDEETPAPDELTAPDDESAPAP